MFIDLTLSVSKALSEQAMGNEKKASFGHLGTHFDVMDKEFPLDYLEREAIVFDVSGIRNRDIEVADIDMTMLKKGMFVTFYSHFISEVPYGSKEYFKTHPQLSQNLIQQLIDKQIAIIGIDFAGVRRGKEHPEADQLCADNGVFVVENLCHLDKLLQNQAFSYFTAHTYPVKFEGLSGLPCRVVGEV